MGRLKGDERAARRRPGLFRRFILRPLLWCLVVLALSLSLLRWWLDTPEARRLAKREIVERLSEHIDREVTLLDISFELLPFSLELRGFEIAGATEGDPPFLRAPYAYLEADIDALRHRRLHLRYVRLERPEIDLRFFPDGGDNLIGDGLGNGEREFELWIDQVEIAQGNLGLDHERVPLNLEASTLRSQLRGLGDRRLEGKLMVRDVIVELPEARPVRVSVVADGGLEAGRLWVDNAQVQGDGIDGEFTGECAWQKREDRKCHFKTRGSAQGQTLAKLGYFDSLRGRFRFDGAFGWRPGSVGWRGQVEADTLDLWQRQLTDVIGELSADRFGILLALEQAKYVGGSLTGDISVAVAEPERPLTVAVDFKDLWLTYLLTDQGIPVEGLSAWASGQALYQCPLKSCRRGDGQAEVTLRPSSPSQGLPVSGRFPLRVADGVIFADAANILAERQSLLATGWYRLPSRSGSFDYQIDTADAGELVPLLPLGSIPSYAPIDGAGHLEGILHVEEGRIWSSVQLGLNDVATAATPQVARVEGGFDVSPWAVENLRLEVRNPPRGSAAGEATLGISGRLPFDGVADLEFDAVRVPMEFVRPWFELPLRLDGQVTGRLEMRLADQINTGRLLAILTSADVAGLPADGLQVDMSWDDGGAVSFERLSLLCEAGTIDATGALDWSTGGLNLALHSERLALGGEPLTAFLPRDDLDGHLVIDGKVEGTLEAPELTLAARAEKLSLGGRLIEADDTRLDLTWNGVQLQGSAFLGGVVELRGGGRLNRERADLGFAVEVEDLAAVAELFGQGPNGDGEMNGRLQISGPLQAPNGRLFIERLKIDLGHRQLASQGTPAITFDTLGWQIAGLSMVEDATDSELAIEGIGSWRIFDGDQGVDLTLSATLDADWIRVAIPDLDVEGRLELEARIDGPLAQPRILGLGQLFGGSLKVPGLTESFSNLEGLVRFEGDQAKIEEVRGDFAGGDAKLTGVVSLGDLTGYRLELEGRGLDVPYLGGWALGGDVDLAMRSTDEGHLLAGTARLGRLEYLDDIRFDLATMVRDALRGQRLQVEPAGGFNSSVQLEVQVLAPDAVRLRNNLADLRGDADFVLRGNLAQPVVFGEIEMKPGGLIEYNESDYKLERGRLIFADPFRLTPEVDLVATTRVRDIDITLALSGPLERLDTRFSSEPPLPDVEVFRLLAGGDAYLDESTDLVAERTAQLGEDRGTSAATFLYGQAASVIGQRVNSLFRFDRFRIDPLTGSADNLSTARVTVGKRLSKDVFVTYSIDPSSTDSQRVQVEWQVANGLVLVLTADGDDSLSADARWETSF